MRFPDREGNSLLARCPERGRPAPTAPTWSRVREARWLLGLRDHLDRVLAYTRGPEGEDHTCWRPAYPWLENLVRARRQVEDELARLGVERCAHEGEPFDPAGHPAMAELGEHASAAAWRVGRAMPLTDALDHAPAAGGAVPTSARTPTASGMPQQPDPLTRRQREVAILVARGLTNRQIANQLVMSKSTARVHVSHILAKLVFHSRAQVAAWAGARGLLATQDAE